MHAQGQRSYYRIVLIYLFVITTPDFLGHGATTLFLCLRHLRARHLDQCRCLRARPAELDLLSQTIDIRSGVLSLLLPSTWRGLGGGSGVWEDGQPVGVR